MKVVVTGAAGFIGSNLVHGLNAIGINDIIAVDDLSDGPKYRNLLNAEISDYFDKSEFYNRFSKGEFGHVNAVFHQGACSNTMEHDGRFMMENNYRCSKDLLENCLKFNTRLFYASSAATYGASETFVENPKFEQPLNVYGYSKLLFDNVVRQIIAKSPVQIAGFRYFNVYGPREQHKDNMASVAFHHFNQFTQNGKVKLFGPYNGYSAGEQNRDFIFVDDVVAVNLWFLQNPNARGIYNLGTGNAQPFNDVAVAVINSIRSTNGLSRLTLDMMLEQGFIEYVDFPQALVGKYQCHTQADLSNLRSSGCSHEFANVAKGVESYVDWLNKK